MSHARDIQRGDRRNPEGLVHRDFPLTDLGRTDLIDLWIKTIGRSPPKHLSIQFLRRALTYEMQCKQIGGHSAETRRALKTAWKRDGTSSSDSSAPSILSAGTQLVREWNGRTYCVDVLENGFSFDGKSYPSLSAIARKITGANWSGPRFFGLVKRTNSATDHNP